MVSVAQVTAVVALATTTSSDTQATKMAGVMASAIELLSLEHNKVATAVQAAVVVRSPGDLMTLTVAGRPAAATERSRQCAMSNLTSNRATHRQCLGAILLGLIISVSL